MYIEGNVPGFSSHLSRYTAPNELLCVTVLANKDNLTDLTTVSRQIAGAYNSTLSGPFGSPWSVATESPYSVNETIDRLRHIITSQGGTIFAEIDHSANAQKVKQSLSETKILVIGNPSKGTDLMKANQSISLDLPLRISVWHEDATKEVWIAFTDPIELAHAYKIEGQDALLAQIHQALTSTIRKATSPNFLK